MGQPVEKIEAEAMELSPDERIALAYRLIASVDAFEEDDDPEDVERAWDEELARRIEDIRTGRVELIPGDEVLAELRAMQK
jgi:putative addiction module component (TIGR02574 family)